MAGSKIERSFSGVVQGDIGEPLSTSTRPSPSARVTVRYNPPQTTNEGRESVFRAPCDGGVQITDGSIRAEKMSLPCGCNSCVDSSIRQTKDSIDYSCDSSLVGLHRQSSFFGATNFYDWSNDKHLKPQKFIVRNSNRNFIRPPNAQGELPEGESEETYLNLLLQNSRIIDDPGGWSRYRRGILVEQTTSSGKINIRIVPPGPWMDFCESIKKRNPENEQEKLNVLKTVSPEPSKDGTSVEKISSKYIAYENSYSSNLDVSLEDIKVENGLLLPKYEVSGFENPKVSSLFIQSSLWRDAIIPYEFDTKPNTDSWSYAENIIIDAMNEWMERTNYSIVFRNVKESWWPFDTGSVDFYFKKIDDSDQLSELSSTETNDDSPASNVDFVDFPSNTVAALYGTALHELGHVIGLKHEHQRSDKELFVNVDENCTKANNTDDQYNETGLLIGPYNGRSIMHYGSCISCIFPWFNGTSNTYPHRLFCPVPQVAFSPNRTSVTLLDGAGAIEMYRLHFNQITPFSPVFDYFPNPDLSSDKGGNAEYLFYGDNVSSLSTKTTNTSGQPGVVVTKFQNENKNLLEKDIFLVVTGRDKQIYVRKLRGDNGQKDFWQWVGAPKRGAFSDPVAVSRSSGNFDIFVTDTAGVIFHCLFTGEGKLGHRGWHPVPLSKVVLTTTGLARPAVAIEDSGSLLIFINDGQSPPRIKMARIFASASAVQLDSTGWSILTNNSFVLKSAPSAVSLGDGRIAVVVTGIENQSNPPSGAAVNNQIIDLKPNKVESVWLRISNKTSKPNDQKIGPTFWSEWTNFVGQVHLRGTNPTISSTGTGKMSIYVRGRDGHLLRRWYANSGWDPYWWDLGGCMASDPGVCENLIVALVGEDPTTAIINNVAPRTAGQIQSVNLGLWYKIDRVG